MSAVLFHDVMNSILGIWFITHAIATGIGGGIGAGILYFVQFIKEYRRQRFVATCYISQF
jgi:hypothetical protein